MGNNISLIQYYLMKDISFLHLKYVSSLFCFLVYHVCVGTKSQKVTEAFQIKHCVWSALP